MRYVEKVMKRNFVLALRHEVESKISSQWRFSRHYYYSSKVSMSILELEDVVEGEMNICSNHSESNVLK